jgi:hypothetical protein
MVHVPLSSGPFQALGRGPPLFCCESQDIFRVSIGLFLSRAICHSMCHLGSVLVFFPVVSRRTCQVCVLLYFHRPYCHLQV